MSILNTLKEDLKVAMKDKDVAKLSVIRMLISEIQVGNTASKPVPEEQSVLRYKKKLEDALQITNDKNSLQREIDIVDIYCPRRPSREDVDAFISTLDLSEHFGLIIKKVKEKFPLADGGMVSDIIKNKKN